MRYFDKYELINKACKFAGFKPKGKRISLHVDEDSNLVQYGLIVEGTIHKLVEHITTYGPTGATIHNELCPVIRLDNTWQISNKATNWLVAIPRHYGYGVYRLCLGSITVHVFPIEDPESIPMLDGTDMLAICSMKLLR